MRCRPLTVLLAALTSVSAVGCGDDSSSSASTDGAAVSGEVVVFAASSLTDAFTAVGEAFTARYPTVEVTFNFAGSGELVTQISQGAPADVFASADDSNMTKLIDAGENNGDAVVIAKNTFQIIVEPGNPKGIVDLADLADPDLIVVLCAGTVPCGKAAATVLENAGVSVTAKSLEDKVKSVVTKVTVGEADAGIVFVTDVIAAGDAADGVEIPSDVNVVSNYPIVVTRAAPNATAAQVFIDFVASDQGQAILAKYGFLAP